MNVKRSMGCMRREMYSGGECVVFVINSVKRAHLRISGSRISTGVPLTLSNPRPSLQKATAMALF